MSFPLKLFELLVYMRLLTECRQLEFIALKTTFMLKAVKKLSLQ